MSLREFLIVANQSAFNTALDAHLKASEGIQSHQLPSAQAIDLSPEFKLPLISDKITEPHSIVDPPVVLQAMPMDATADLTAQQQALGRAVLAFVFAVDAYIHTDAFIKTQSEPCYSNAAVSYVGTVIGALAKGQAAYDFLLQYPESHSIPTALLPCILQHTQAQPLLLSLQAEQYKTFVRQLKNDLSRGQLTQLVQQFVEVSEEKQADDTISAPSTPSIASHAAFFPIAPLVHHTAASLSPPPSQAVPSNALVNVESKLKFS